MSTDSFMLFPAIDVLDGKCVRLRQGRFEERHSVAQDPLGAARRWLEDGAEWLHVVDLNGAKSGSPVNTTVIREIILAAAAVGTRVQVGGGIRTQETIERWLEAGAARCVIGTAAMDVEWMRQAIKQFGSQAIVGGLDGRKGRLAVAGWQQQTDIVLADLGRQLYGVGLRTVLVTDVGRDGMMAGANLELAAALQRETGLSVIASGGIRSLEDMLAAHAAGLAGAVAGRALYEGALTIRQAKIALQHAATQRREAASC